MNYEQWEETYKPKMNHLVPPEDGQQTFETYGIELGYVLGVADTQPNRVWTVVDGEGGTYIVNGYHLVNRINYYITEVPFEGEFLEVLDSEYGEETHHPDCPAVDGFGCHCNELGVQA
jgi:hypothetical protein